MIKLFSKGSYKRAISEIADLPSTGKTGKGTQVGLKTYL